MNPIFFVVTYVLFDVGKDVYQSRKIQRDVQEERCMYDLLNLLHKLGIKSAEAPLQERWARRIAEDPFAAHRKTLFKRNP